MMAGFRHVWRNGLLVAATIIMAVSGLVVAAQYSLVTAVGEPPSFLGVLSDALGAGSTTASLLSGRLLARVGERGLVLWGLGYYPSEVCYARWVPCQRPFWGRLSSDLPYGGSFSESSI